MNPDLEGISARMREFGCYILGRAVYEATFSDAMKPFSHEISVTLAAHAAEIIIKARIAQEHPLLIFDKLPKSTGAQDLLGIDEIMDKGKTIQLFELPERLWATIGYRVDEVPLFHKFRKLRNNIIHFAPPQAQELSDVTLKFVFEVIDPMLGEFWDDTVVDYVEIWDDVIITDGYLQEQLNRLEIQPTTGARKLLEERRYDPD